MLRSKLSRSCVAWLTAVSGIAPALLLTALAAPAVVRADDAKVSGEVTVVLAKEAEGEYDAKLKQLPALQKPPFNGFKSMKVLSTTPVELGADKTPSVALPNGRSLQLKLLENMADGRHKVQIAIKQEGKPDKLITVVASGEPFFVAGQSFEGGTLVIGVRVGGAAAAAAAPAPKK
jgi:hypothetical protein